MSESGDLFISSPSYSLNPAAQTLRQNVKNYLERERPFSSYSPMSPPLSIPPERERPSEFEVRTNSSVSNINNKRRGSEITYSYVKKFVKGPQGKIIRIQIFDAEEFNDSKLCECNCKADVCAQHVVENVFGDDIYICAKDMVNKMLKKMI